jgi:hypothetical protein
MVDKFYYPSGNCILSGSTVVYNLSLLWSYDRNICSLSNIVSSTSRRAKSVYSASKTLPHIPPIRLSLS